MKMVKRVSSVLMAILLTASILFPAAAIEVPVSGTDLSGQLIILHTNDTHGHLAFEEGKILGISAVAQLKKDYEAAGAEVLLLDAGDTIQGTAIASTDSGAGVIQLMNMAGYDAMTPGNHEFDYGLETLLHLSGTMEFPLLSANLTCRSTGDLIFNARTILETDSGRKIGIIGLSTPETMTASHPEKVAELEFNGSVLYARAQEQVDELKAAGCDLIIAVGHLGTAPASAPYRSVDIIENTTGIDLFIDGHSHTEIDGGERVDETLLVSSGEHFYSIGAVAFDGREFSAKLIRPGDYSRTDPSIDFLLAQKEEEVVRQLATPFSSSSVDLKNMYDDGNVLNAETNLGDLATDAMLYSAQETLGDHVIAALTNGGGIRDAISAGPISRRDITNVFPFGNQISVVSVTGSQLLEALEAACAACPEEAGAFPQVSGISFTIDTAYPYVKGTAYPDSTFFMPAAPGKRIKDVSVGGKPLDLSEVYHIATNDFVAAGGDSYRIFQGLPVQETGILLEDALVNYIGEYLAGVIGAEYELPQNRIRIAADASDATLSWSNGYVVVGGDSLWSISMRIYGSGTKWTLIYEANKGQIANPNLIYTGQTLKIPM